MHLDLIFAHNAPPNAKTCHVVCRMVGPNIIANPSGGMVGLPPLDPLLASGIGPSPQQIEYNCQVQNFKAQLQKHRNELWMRDYINLRGETTARQRGVGRSPGGNSLSDIQIDFVTLQLPGVHRAL